MPDIIVCNLPYMSNNNSPTTLFKIILVSYYLCRCIACSVGPQKNEKIMERSSSAFSRLDSLLNSLSKVNLSHNFIGLDTTGNVIDKASFMTFISSGEYVPLEVASKDTLRYKLYRYPPFDETKGDELLMKLMVKNFAETEYNNYKMTGSPFPSFNFTDLNGDVYNTQNTKGKIIVVKCWFVGCKPCVAEIPALNEIVKQYANRKGIVFISLSFDSKKELHNFLLRTPFSYAVIADQRYYLSDVLKVSTYPTHIVVNKQGVVVSISNDYDEMVSALKTVASK